MKKKDREKKKADMPEFSFKEFTAEENRIYEEAIKSYRESIAAGKKLSLIVRAGAGVNTIDVDAAPNRGTTITLNFNLNPPGERHSADTHGPAAPMN